MRSTKLWRFAAVLSVTVLVAGCGASASDAPTATGGTAAPAGAAASKTPASSTAPSTTAAAATPEPADPPAVSSTYDYTGERIEKDVEAQFPDARVIAPGSVEAGNLPDLCDVLSPQDLQAFTGYEMEESVGGVGTSSGLYNPLTGKDDMRQATSACSWSGVENHFKIKADITVGPLWSAKAWRKLNPGVATQSRGKLGKSYYFYSDGSDLVTLAFWRGTMTYTISGYLDDRPVRESSVVRLGEKLLNGLPDGPR